MTSIRLAIAALVTVGLAAAPFTAEAKKHRSARNYGMYSSGPVPASTYGSVTPPATQPRTYGSSGQPIGTVTAPSIGTYSWPSVGVTNAVPTWSNTNPPVR